MSTNDSFDSRDINARNDLGQTRLIRAAKQGDFILVKRLIAAGADISLVDKSKATARMTASLNRHDEIEGYLSSAEEDLQSPEYLLAKKAQETFQASSEVKKLKEQKAAALAAKERCWFYSNDLETQKGPTSLHDLRELFKNETINKETLVWSPNLDKWKPLHEVTVIVGLEDQTKDTAKNVHHEEIGKENIGEDEVQLDPLLVSEFEKLKHITKDKFALDYMPVSEFAKLKYITKDKAIEMVRDGFYEGRIKNGQWFINKNKLSSSELETRTKSIVTSEVTATSDGFIPVKEFAENKVLHVDKVVSMIKDGFYIGRLIDGEWYVASHEVSSLAGSKEDVTYKSLGIWRKIYLWLNWISLIILAFILITNPQVALSPMEAIYLGIYSVLGLPYVIWLHMATVNRKVLQLRILAGVNIGFFANPLSAAVVWMIGSVSKDELSPSK